MLGPTMAAAEMEPVEPQNLKKLSFKLLKRALDFFSPARAHPMPPRQQADSDDLQGPILKKLHRALRNKLPRALRRKLLMALRLTELEVTKVLLLGED